MRFHFTRIALTILGLVWVSISQATENLNAEAKKHFEAGVAYVDDPSGSKWEEALKEFQAAYKESPTWKLLNNIGLCSLNLERDGEAIAAYSEYLSHGGERDFTKKQRKQMEKDIAMLTASLVTVKVKVEPSEVMLIDERKTSKGTMVVNRYPITDGKVSLGIHPGHHRFAIETQGYVSDSWLFEADPGSKHEHRFILQIEKGVETPIFTPEPESTKPDLAKQTVPRPANHQTPTAVYIGLAATGVFAAAATATGVITMGKSRELNATADPAARHDIASSGRTYSLLTDIGIGAAVLSAGVTAYLYLTIPKEQPTQATASPSIKLQPMASPKLTGLSILGKF